MFKITLTVSAIPLGICYARRASLNFNELHDNGFGLVDTALIDYALSCVSTLCR